MKLLIYICLTILFLEAKGMKTVFTKTIVENNHINVFLINKNLFDITLTYDVRNKYLSSNKSFPFTASYKPNSITKIASFIIKDKKFSYQEKYNWILGNKEVVHDNAYEYRLPYQIDSKQKITQGFNGNFSHIGKSQYAIDFGLTLGTKVFASREGIVVSLKKDSNKTGNTREYLKHANYITIKHPDGTYATYNHLKKNSFNVELGDIVGRGAFLALSGNSGFTNGPHLHLVVFKAINSRKRESIPIRFISQKGIIKIPKRDKYYIAVP